MITLDKETHRYYVDGKVANTSVTKMLHDQGLAPNYNGVSAEVLAAKAEQGTAYHEEMERITKGGEPTSEYGKMFKVWFDENVEKATAEQPFVYEENGYIIGGSVDLYGWLKTGEPFVADYKFTSTFPREYVTWQTSIYSVFIGKTVKGWIAAKQYCFHFTGGKMKVVGLPPKKITDVKDLLTCECNGDYYLTPSLTPSDENLPSLWENAELKLCALQAQIKAQEDEVKSFRKRMAAEMEKQGVVKYEGEHVRISYIAAHETTRVDNNRLKDKYPEVYADCVKTSTTAASVRVTVKDNETNKD